MGQDKSPALVDDWSGRQQQQQQMTELQAYRQDTFAHEALGEPLDDALKLVPLIGAADTVANCVTGNCSAAGLAMATLGVVLPESKVLAPVEDAARVASRGGESTAAAIGRRAHSNYGTALGEKYDTRVVLPSGRKPDAVNFERREVRELKPDKQAAVRRGERQVEGYRKELEEITGEPWTSAIDVYRTGGSP